jgi:threonine synthase
MKILDISCTNCGRAYPLDGAPYRCEKCGGLFDFGMPLSYSPAEVDATQPGIWRYRHTFGLPQGVEPVSLGEGNTPLLWAEVFGRQVAFKAEFLNPTGSFKDRGSSLIATFLRSRGINAALEDSSGNAGASFAAYAARAGMSARIFAPLSAAGPKRAQIEAYGAELVTIPGSRGDVAEAAKRDAEKGTAYASHAYLPQNIPGYATAAYEIFEQLGVMPSAVIVPAGQGGLLLGLARGFFAIQQATRVVNLPPKIIGVQASACAPLWAVEQAGGALGLGFVTEGETLAEGVRVRLPLRGDVILQTVQKTGGKFIAVDEAHILPGRDELAQRGLYVEPTSAIVWRALEETLSNLPDPVVVMLTGSGFKYQPANAGG